MVFQSLFTRSRRSLSTRFAASHGLESSAPGEALNADKSMYLPIALITLLGMSSVAAFYFTELRDRDIAITALKKANDEYVKEAKKLFKEYNVSNQAPAPRSSPNISKTAAPSHSSTSPGALTLIPPDFFPGDQSVDAPRHDDDKLKFVETVSDEMA